MSEFIVPIQKMQPMSFSNTASTQSTSSPAGSFGSILSDAIQEYQALSETSAQNSTSLALGNVDDLAGVEINSMKAESMLQTTVQLTTRAVNAYKEIMQMSV